MVSSHERTAAASKRGRLPRPLHALPIYTTGQPAFIHARIVDGETEKAAAACRVFISTGENPLALSG